MDSNAGLIRRAQVGGADGFGALVERHMRRTSLGPIELANSSSVLAREGETPRRSSSWHGRSRFLQVVHEPPLEELVGKFDRLLRLYGEPAQNAMLVAEKLTTATRLSAATFPEMLDATVAAASPPWATSSDEE
jgi:hypothetical protein